MLPLPVGRGGAVPGKHMLPSALSSLFCGRHGDVIPVIPVVPVVPVVPVMHQASMMMKVAAGSDLDQRRLLDDEQTSDGASNPFL